MDIQKDCEAYWASRAIDLISIALSNPYQVSMRLITAHLLEIESEGALRGAREMSETVHAALDRWDLNYEPRHAAAGGPGSSQTEQ